MKNVAFHNLGCKVNSYELDVVQQNFVKRGYKIVPFDQMADIYVINTCTVTNIADRKSRQMIHRAKKQNPLALVVALGCYVQTENAGLDPDIDIAIGNNRKKDTVKIVESYLEKRCGTDGISQTGQAAERKQTIESNIIDIARACEYEEMTLKQTVEHTRAYIKIQDGCNQFCSYCIIPFARGRVRSRKEEDICREIAGLAAAGYCEFVLTGIHISSYGVDLEGKPSLLSLILRIRRIEGVVRIRLGSLEPRIVTGEFARALGEIGEMCPHFHLSLQSGCDETLKRMNRHYTTGEYRESVDRLRENFNDPAITTDVIVGFPGETDEEFAKTEAFLRETGFFEMHIFPFSPRKGTVAAGMKEQVSGEVKKHRSRRLLELEKEQSRQYRSRFVGREETVLFEEKKEIAGQFYQIGHTARYVKVARKTDEDLSGRLIRGRITGILNEEVLLME